jgi:excisionase family DNA binding protein
MISSAAIVAGTTDNDAKLEGSGASKSDNFHETLVALYGEDAKGLVDEALLPKKRGKSGLAPPSQAPLDDFILQLLGPHALYTVPDLIRILRISEPSVYRQMRAGKIPYVAMGRARRVKREVLIRIMQEGLEPTAA